MHFAGHSWRAKQELTSNLLLLWSPSRGRRRVGHPAITYIDQLCRDKGCPPNNLPALLQDGDGWRDGLMIALSRKNPPLPSLPLPCPLNNTDATILLLWLCYQKHHLTLLFLISGSVESSII